MTGCVPIFGGSGGLGEAAARRVGENTPVVVGYHSAEDRATEIAREITDKGGSASTAQVDSCDPDSVQRFLDGAARRWNGIDGVVSAIGVHPPLTPLYDLETDQYRSILEVEVVGTFNIVKYSVGVLKAAGGGPIVIGSLNAPTLRTLETDGPASTAKAACAAIVRYIAREAGQFNVRCNGIASGLIAGPGLAEAMLGEMGEAKALVENLLSKTPVPRSGASDDFASLVDFLLSPGASYINGQIIGLDGGFSA